MWWQISMPGTALGIEFDPEWRITLVTLLMVPLMVGLGFWQLQRADEKAALAASFEQRQVQRPALLNEIRDNSAASLAYLPVRVSGSFLPDTYFLLDNRIQGGRFGYEVLGILQVEGSGDTVLVNRGWVAGDPARLELPDVPPQAGLVDVTGYVYVAPGKPYLLAEQALEPGWPKVIQAVEMDKLVPPVVELTGGKVFLHPVRINAGSPGALSVDWRVINVSPAKHQGYAVQWLTMATVLFIFYLLRCSNIWQLLTKRNGNRN